MNGTLTKEQFVAADAVEAWAEGVKIAADETRTLEYKMQAIAERFETATNKTKEREDYEIESVDADVAKLKKVARQPFLPSRDLIPSLNYARDLLAEKVAEMSQAELAALLKTVIEAGEKIAAQAAKDFLPSMIKRKLAGTDEFYAEPLFRPLLSQIDELLSTPEQREARQKLEALEAKRRSLLMAGGKAREKLERGHWAIERNQLVERWRETPRF